MKDMSFGSILHNQVLIAALIAWMMAQSIKLPIDYIKNREWNWALLFSAGGMPSSHSALVVSVALATGLFQGFDSPVFALAVAIAMIVTYDASGVRREAGIHAQKINMLIRDVFEGQPITEDSLKEVLGHTRLEVLAGTLLGIGVSLTYWLIWR